MRAKGLLVAIAGPAVLWLAAAVVVLCASLFGYRAGAAPPDLTLPEAAAIRDEAEVLRQLRAGVDPDAVALVRRGFVSDPEYFMTPLEAGTARRHLGIVSLLVANGAALTEANVPVLVCLALEHGAADIVAFLRERTPGFTVECKDVRLPL